MKLPIVASAAKVRYEDFQLHIYMYIYIHTSGDPCMYTHAWAGELAGVRAGGWEEIANVPPSARTFLQAPEHPHACLIYRYIGKVLIDASHTAD